MGDIDLDSFILTLMADSSEGMTVRNVRERLASEGMEVNRNRVAGHLTWMANVGTLTKTIEKKPYRMYVYKLTEVSE